MSTQQPAGERVHRFGVSDRVRVAREDAGYEQGELAETTGLSRASISNYERGVSKPRRAQMNLIAMATGFDRGWLETGREPNPDGDGSENSGPDDEGRTQTHWFNVSPGQRHLAAVA